MKSLFVLVLIFALCSIAHADYEAWIEYDSEGYVSNSEVTGTKPLLDQSLKYMGEQPRSIHPSVTNAIESKVGLDEYVEVVITVQPTYRLTKSQKYIVGEDRDSAGNQFILEQRKLIRQADDALRSTDRAPVVEAIKQLGGEVLLESVIGNAIIILITPRQLEKLLADYPVIKTATLSTLPAEPPSYYVSSSRDVMNTDQMEDVYGSDVRIGLLDTGVRNTHETLYPSQIGMFLDCVYGNYSTCLFWYHYPEYIFFNPSDAATGYGHGTYMADVIAGDNSGGDSYRGVAPDALIDSANIYSGAAHDTLSVGAIVSAYLLLDIYDDIILTNAVDYEGTYYGTVSWLANDMYDVGMIMIAPAGNDSDEVPGSPANAYKVLSVGGYLTFSPTTEYIGSAGYDDHWKYKPEIAGPTYIYAASNASNSAYTWKSGTCPAAAFITGAAAVLKSMFDYNNWDSSPAFIYSAIIAFGDDEGWDGSGDYDGAGPFKMGDYSNSVWITGTKTMEDDDVEYVYIWYSGGDRCNLKAGLWWPTDIVGTMTEPQWAKVEIDLERGLTVIDRSYNVESSWGHVKYDGDLQSGVWWRLRIELNSISKVGGSVDVHYMVYTSTDCN